MMSRLRRDDGATLVELIVNILLMSIVSALITTVVISANKVVQHSSDENQGLSDAKTVSERLSRDLRDARGIASGADSHHLVVWIDANSDYIQQSSETVSWTLRPSAGSPGHFDVVRTVGSLPEVVEARTLVSDIAFTYSPAPPATNFVTTQMTYDAVVGSGSTARTVSFSTRLRNVR